LSLKNKDRSTAMDFGESPIKAVEDHEVSCEMEQEQRATGEVNRKARNPAQPDEGLKQLYEEHFKQVQRYLDTKMQHIEEKQDQKMKALRAEIRTDVVVKGEILRKELQGDMQVLTEDQREMKEELTRLASKSKELEERVNQVTCVPPRDQREYSAAKNGDNSKVPATFGTRRLPVKTDDEDSDGEVSRPGKRTDKKVLDRIASMNRTMTREAKPVVTTVTAQQGIVAERDRGKAGTSAKGTRRGTPPDRV